jgi:uncharacterized protein (TIGR03086 family)
VDVAKVHRITCETFADLVRAVRAEQWGLGTPCTRWTVRDLVNHVVGEDLWTPPLFGGATVAEVGDRFAGDVLGTDPPAVSDAAAVAAMSAVSEPDAIARTVQVSFGDISGEEYAWQLAFDHLVHAWDLSRALGTDPTFDPAVVRACAAWFDDAEELYRAGGAIAARASTPAHASSLQQLVARTGRDPDWDHTMGAVLRLNQAFADHDVEAIVACFTQDGVFDATTPAPDGALVEGTDALRAQWTRFFAETRDPRFDVEELFSCGAHAVMRWRFRWSERDGTEGHVRGVDVLLVRDARIAEKRSYVKG